MNSSYPHFDLQGPLGRALRAVTDHWLLVAPLSNPAMLEIFATRDAPPYRNMMPWAGEFAGKYLTAAVQVYRVTRDERLLSFLRSFVARLVSLQAPDGYLGPWPPDSRLANFSPHHGKNGMHTWDTWGHYHVMIGLILWHEETGDEAALACACRIADLICKKYLVGPGGADGPAVRLVETGSTEMNLAPVHALAKLHRLTGADRYLRMALQLQDEFAARDSSGVPLAGDYFNLALAGKCLYEMPRPRWESLHPILGLVELYRITGEAPYRQAFESIWWGIIRHDRHNNGGFSSGEQATGNPYDYGTIETCCTIAWLALSAEMLKLTGDSRVADEIELTTLNSILGMHSASGRWSTFTTPMDGARFASAQAIVFQARSGSPELNCCSVNSPRGFGLISEWALLQDGDTLALNYYGASSIRAVLPNGVSVCLAQETDYPLSGQVRLKVMPSASVEFTLRLRVPAWSQHTSIRLNGQASEAAAENFPLETPQPGILPGSYYEIRRVWQEGDSLQIDLDMSLHFWQGERECQGLTSVYRGPVLLAYDQRYNLSLASPSPLGPIPDDCFKVSRDHLPVPVVDISRLEGTSLAWESWHSPLLLLRAATADGQPVWLCDFASAGATGTLYRSWLPVQGAGRESPFCQH